jgi:hypothetical protein
MQALQTLIALEVGQFRQLGIGNMPMLNGQLQQGQGPMSNLSKPLIMVGREPPIN